MTIGIKNNSEYKYYIFKENVLDNTASFANGSDGLKTCWSNYVICDITDEMLENNIPIYTIDENNIWQFNLEIQNGGITQNINKTVHITFGKFARTGNSYNNYDSGSMSCLFGEVSSSQAYLEPSDKFDAWKAFINNGNMKLLKDIKGNAWIVDITESNIAPDDTFSEIPSTLTFGWVQVNATLDKGFVSYD